MNIALIVFPTLVNVSKPSVELNLHTLSVNLARPHPILPQPSPKANHKSGTPTQTCSQIRCSSFHCLFRLGLQSYEEKHEASEAKFNLQRFRAANCQNQSYHLKLRGFPTVRQRVANHRQNANVNVRHLINSQNLISKKAAQISEFSATLICPNPASIIIQFTALGVFLHMQG